MKAETYDKILSIAVDIAENNVRLTQQVRLNVNKVDELLKLLESVEYEEPEFVIGFDKTIPIPDTGAKEFDETCNFDDFIDLERPLCNQDNFYGFRLKDEDEK